jgi:hypothetical protein
MVMSLSELLAKIDEFLKKKSLSKKDQDIVAGLLYEFCTHTNDKSEFAHKILQFPTEIVGILLKKESMSIETLNSIIDCLMLDSFFIENKNDISFSVSCEILAAYLEKGNPPDCVFNIFNKSLLMIDKGKKFADKNLNKYNR